MDCRYSKFNRKESHASQYQKASSGNTLIKNKHRFMRFAVRNSVSKVGDIHKKADADSPRI